MRRQLRRLHTPGAAIVTQSLAGLVGFSPEVVPIKDRSSPSLRPLQHKCGPASAATKAPFGSQENHAETIGGNPNAPFSFTRGDDMRKCSGDVFRCLVLRKRRILTWGRPTCRAIRANGKNATLVMAPTWLSDPRRTLGSHCPFIHMHRAAGRSHCSFSRIGIP